MSVRCRAWVLFVVFRFDDGPPQAPVFRHYRRTRQLQQSRQAARHFSARPRHRWTGSKPVWAKRSLNAARPVSRRRRLEHCCTLMRVLSGGTVSRRTGADERRAQRRRDLAGYPARSCHQHIAQRRQRVAPDACLAFVARRRKEPTRSAGLRPYARRGHLYRSWSDAQLISYARARRPTNYPAKPRAGGAVLIAACYRTRNTPELGLGPAMTELPFF